MFNRLFFSTKFNLFGLTLRGLSMLGKFLLIVMITKSSTLDQLGIYGIFVTTVVLVNYVQGLEFHAFSSRQILGESDIDRSTMIGNQLLLYVFSYILFLPMALFLFYKEFVPWELLFVFYWVVIVTHLGQEAQRLLIVLSSLNQAYIVSFLVHGVWAFVACYLIYFDLIRVDLNSIFLLWGASASAGVIFGAYFLRYRRCFDFSSHFKINAGWIIRGLRVSSMFFVGVIGFKIIEFSDRYFISFYHGDVAVGIYTLYASVANFALEFIYTGIVVGIFPSMIASFNLGKMQEYQRLRARMTKHVIFGVAAVFFLLLVLIQGIILYAGKPELSQNLSVFILLLISVSVINLSLIPNYVLYVHGKDKIIMWSVVSGMCINVLLNFLFIPKFGIFGAAWATLISFLLVAIIKLHCARPLS